MMVSCGTCGKVWTRRWLVRDDLCGQSVLVGVLGEGEFLCYRG